MIELPLLSPSFGLDGVFLSLGLLVDFSSLGSSLAATFGSVVLISEPEPAGARKDIRHVRKEIKASNTSLGEIVRRHVDLYVLNEMP